MIKLIASDLDGTLLREGRLAITQDMIDIIRRLNRRNILFVAASGRQYPNMKRLFAPVWRDMAFAAENGAIILYRDEVIFQKTMDRALGQALMRDIQASGHQALLCCREASYITSADREYGDHLFYGLRNTMAIADDLLCIDSEYLKISAYIKEGNAAAVAAPYLEKWGGRFHVAVAGNRWVDFTSSNKGEAIGALQSRLGLQREEMMAFGDNFNDVTMFQAVEYSYAMELAHPQVKQGCFRVCSSVESVLHSLLKEEDAALPGCGVAPEFAL